MTTVFTHLSDLHFGRSRVRTLTHAILRAIDDAGAQAVVCSGDMVELAGSASAWREVKTFLASVQKPLVVVPGNHDQERLNVWKRLRAPLQRFREATGSHDELPLLQLDGAVIAGLKTPRRWSLDLGHISRRQLTELEQQFAGSHGLRVVAMHHPLLPRRRIVLRSHVWDSRRIVNGLIQAGAELVLTGHNHYPRVEVIEREHGRLVWAQAGTAGSSRLRNRAKNAMNVVRANDTHFVVEWWFYDEATRRFSLAESHEHQRAVQRPHERLKAQ